MSEKGLNREWFFAREPSRDRVALFENMRLAEYYEESAAIRVRPGSIYAGIVRDVAPSLDAAFVEIGPGEQAFLQSDATYEIPAAGKRVLVQITQAARSRKAPQATLALKLPGRFLVLMPGSDYVGISKSIDGGLRRAALRSTLDTLLRQMGKKRGGQSFGVIARSRAAQAETRVLEAELKALLKRWDRIESDFSQAKRGRRAGATLLYAQPAPASRLLRDRVSVGDRVIVAGETLFDELEAALDKLSDLDRSESALRIELSPLEPGPLFEMSGIEAALREAGARRCVLPNGGNIVIDYTEALTAVDVNSARFSSARVMEETAFRTNREAAVATARRLRLKNISGIIIVDFIEMRDPAHADELERVFAEELSCDPARIRLLPLDELGLAKLTRKKY